MKVKTTRTIQVQDGQREYRASALVEEEPGFSPFDQDGRPVLVYYQGTKTEWVFSHPKKAVVDNAVEVVLAIVERLWKEYRADQEWIGEKTL